MQIIHGNCLDEIAKMESNSIDFIVTDPPYGLYYMSKTWDKEIPSVEYWKEALRVCKPGSMMAVFGGSRTHHRLMCAIEDAEWEIRDVIMWLYGTGFPKSNNNFGLNGYGTALKPAYEPIVLAMKPLDGTYAQNFEKWGLGGINIDGSRIDNITKGRWPANIILDEEAGKLIDEQSGFSKSSSKLSYTGLTALGQKSGWNKHNNKKVPLLNYGDSGGASRFFYCAKTSTKERNLGCESLPIKQTIGGGGINNTIDDVCGKYGSIKTAKNNFHPTVKPISLMKYIINLLAPPGNPIILDPFLGSGSTLIAAKELGINGIGIEINEEYCEIARNRINHYKEAI